MIRRARIAKPPTNAHDHSAGLSRRDMLASIGLAGVYTFAVSAMLVPSPSLASTNTPLTEPDVDPLHTAQADVAECNMSEHDVADLNPTDLVELSAQRRRRYRRHWRYWRRRPIYWRRRYWRPRYRRRRYGRVICRRRWRWGRLVRVCYRVW